MNPQEKPQSYEEALARLAEKDERIVVMTAENRAAIRGLPARLGPRFLDVGICEQTMVGMAAGLALRGRIPVVHALATFLTMRAFEFIRTDVGLPGLPVKLVGSIPGVLSEANGPTHQAIEDVALMRAIPGLDIVCPADAEELVAALPAILSSPRPAYIRFNDKPAQVSHVVPAFEWGRAESLSRGSDVAILTYGTMLGPCDAARAALEAEGLSVGLVNLRSLVPLDEEAVLGAARSARLLVTVEDHFLVGGLATLVAEALTRRQVRVDLQNIGFDGRWFRTGLLSDVLRVEHLDGPGLAGRIRERVKGGRTRG
jgi:transketolase